MGEPIDLDPIDPTPIGPGLTAVPLAPTPWDDCEDGQHAVTGDGTVFVRRRGLWHFAAWWQGTDGAEIIAICLNPGEWAYDTGWPRKMVEDAKGPLTPISLPATYPHDDHRCRQDSIDADGFRTACREVAQLAEVLGISDAGLGIGGVIDRAIQRIKEGDRG